MKYKYLKMVDVHDTEEHVYFRIFEPLFDEYGDFISNAQTSKYRFPISVVENMISENNFSSLDVWYDEFRIDPSKINFGRDLRNLFAVNLSWETIPTSWIEV